MRSVLILTLLWTGCSTPSAVETSEKAAPAAQPEPLAPGEEPPPQAIVPTSDTPPPTMQCQGVMSGREGCYLQIPAGRFLMGAQSTDPAGANYDPDAQPNEGPVHEVSLPSFWIQRDEYSVLLLSGCIIGGGCDVNQMAMDPADREIFSALAREGSNIPVSRLNYAAAEALCHWLGGRLPTEAEWEYAARGPESRIYPWGDEPGCGVLPSGPSGPSNEPPDPTQCVQTEPYRSNMLAGPSPFGVRGMGGNLWEWTSDWYAKDAYDRHEKTSPKGPKQGSLKVLRGGGFTASDPFDLRTAGRLPIKPETTLPDVGVRCVWRGIE